MAPSTQPGAASLRELTDMAVFDPNQQKIVVRIVYDGVEEAGKTTNVRKLCEIFSPRRRSDLVSPEELEGRTLFFDWVEIACGASCGYPLVCQVVTVPGQVVLEPRRRRLLASADAIVYVSDSVPEAIGRSREGLALLQEVVAMRPHPVPIVVQANKQDRRGALSVDALLGLLLIDDGAEAVPARALEGHGVLETFVLAVRKAASALQDRVGPQAASSTDDTREADRGRELGLPTGSPEAAEALHKALAEIALGVEDWAKWILTPPRRGEDVAATIVPGAPSIVPEPPVATPSDVVIDTPDPLEGSTSGRLTERAGPPDAPLPTADVPTGYIWPATTGRETLRSVDVTAARFRPDLASEHEVIDENGPSYAIVFEAGRLGLRTSRARRFEDADAARRALVQLAREKTHLGELLPPGTVLALQPDDKGALWLWTVGPLLRPLRARLVDAALVGDEEGLAAALVDFAEATVEAALLFVQRRIRLDVNPSSFARVPGGRVVYVADEVEEMPSGALATTLGEAMLQRVDEYGYSVTATEAYLDALERRLDVRVTADAARALRIHDAVASAVVHTAPALEAKDRLTRFLARRFSAALPPAQLVAS